MKFLSLSSLFIVAMSTPAFSAAEEQCSTTWKCHPISTGSNPPVLDADHSDWKDVEAYTTTLQNTVGEEWEAGKATYKCLYDTEYIYFALEIPGEYRFSTEDNHFCASVATMMKIGEKATFVNMGGCPDAMGGCGENGTTIPETCDEYRVDIGAHWELKGTEQSTLYEMSSTVTDQRQAGAGGTGNDLVANKDDEYAVSPYCRFDDDDAKADNEWSGAWAHTNPLEGEFGVYHFEVSRTLTTASERTDAQLSPGETVQFGVAFWDPFQTEEEGWNDIGHYVTGCGTKWIDLELTKHMEEATNQEEESEAEPIEDKSSGVFFGAYLSFALLAYVFVGLF